MACLPSLIWWRANLCLRHRRAQRGQSKLGAAGTAPVVTAYAPETRDKLVEYANETLSIGALHSALELLESRGLVESWMAIASWYLIVPKDIQSFLFDM